jgi:uncharacterized protein YceK
MVKWPAFVFPFAVTLLLSGCGTAMNTLYFMPIEGGKSVYGGIKVDWSVMRDCAADAGRSENIGDRIDHGSKALLLALDMPFSAVGDTLTLPITIEAALKKQRPLHAPTDSPSDSLLNQGAIGSN